jgi:lipopolysaccharide transport system ATP-binding protein
MGNMTVIEIKDLSKKYRLYKKKSHRARESLFPFLGKLHTEFYALRGINLKVQQSEVLGILGRNGSGKSTLMKSIAGILTPTSGKVIVKGNVVPLLELGSGFHPEFTGIENIYFYTSLLGLEKREIESKIDEIIEFAEIGEHIHQEYRTYSSGMRARLAFSVSVHIDPEILILDEVLSVGDAVFKKKSYEKIKSFFDAGKTILFVSHSMESIISLCSRAIIMDKGEKILDGETQFVVDQYNRLIKASKEEYPDVRKSIMELNR